MEAGLIADENEVVVQARCTLRRAEHKDACIRAAEDFEIRGKLHRLPWR